eukprot:7797844-Prorocentrum_lima.AAC.1
MNLVSSSRSGAFLSYGGGVSAAASQMSAMGSASTVGNAMEPMQVSARQKLVSVEADDEVEDSNVKQFDMN